MDKEEFQGSGLPGPNGAAATESYCPRGQGLPTDGLHDSLARYSLKSHACSSRMHTPQGLYFPEAPSFSPNPAFVPSGGIWAAAGDNDLGSVRRALPSGHLHTLHRLLSHERHLPGAERQEFTAISLALSLALGAISWNGEGGKYFPQIPRRVILGIRCAKYEKDAPLANMDMFPSAQCPQLLEKGRT